MISSIKSKMYQFALTSPSIEAVLIVGSYARNTQTETSDLDFIIISSDKERILEDSGFIEQFGKLKLIRVEQYGACTSLHTIDETGFEIEFGIVRPSWLTLPLDPGTDSVLKDGYEIVYDEKSIIKGHVV